MLQNSTEVCDSKILFLPNSVVDNGAIFTDVICLRSSLKNGISFDFLNVTAALFTQLNDFAQNYCELMSFSMSTWSRDKKNVSKHFSHRIDSST